MACWFVVVVALELPARAQQFGDVMISAETVGQAYQVRAGDGTLSNRRRLTQSLALDYLGDSWLTGNENNQIVGSIRLRIDAELDDFGKVATLSGRTPPNPSGPAPVEILHAFVEARRLGGIVTIRLGRQWQLEPFRLRAFDGAWVEAQTPFGIVLETWGGLAVSGESPVDSPIYRQDGLALDRNPTTDVAARLEHLWQPTFGVGMRSVDNRYFDGRIWYVRTFSLIDHPELNMPRLGIAEERLNMSWHATRVFGVFRPYVDLSVNLVSGIVDDVAAGVALAWRHHRVAADFVRSLPSFDGDSIWNVFAMTGFDDLRVGYDYTGAHLLLSTRAFFRHFESGSGAKIGGTNASLTWRASRGMVRVDVHGEGGAGTTAGVDAAARLRLWGDVVRHLDLEGRLSFLHADDPLRAARRIDSFGVQAGLRWVPAQGVGIHFLVEENANRVVLSQLRVLAMLDLSYALSATPRGRTVRPGFLP